MKVAMPVLGFALVLGLASSPAAQNTTTTTCGTDVFLNVQVIGTPLSSNGNALISDGDEFYNHGASPRRRPRHGSRLRSVRTACSGRPTEES